MSSYPDNMDWAAYRAAGYGDDEPIRNYPTWDEIHAIARKHLEPAFRAMATELDKGWPDAFESAITDDDLTNLIEWTISDGVTDAINGKYADSVNNEE